MRYLRAGKYYRSCVEEERSIIGVALQKGGYLGVRIIALILSLLLLSGGLLGL